METYGQEIIDFIKENCINNATGAIFWEENAEQELTKLFLKLAKNWAINKIGE